MCAIICLHMSKQSPQPLSEPYLTVGQAAERLSVHPSTIRRWIDRGRLTAYRLGEKRIGVRPSDLARLVAPRPPRPGQGGRLARSERPATPRLTKREQRRGLQALAELERLSATIAARHGPLPESWELLNESRDERTRDLMRTVEE
jgi:excisionase family DNA binding protein